MAELKAHWWCVTASWYDQDSSAPPFMAHTKQRAINECKSQFPAHTWPKLKRQGWYVTRLELRWTP